MVSTTECIKISERLLEQYLMMQAGQMKIPSCYKDKLDWYIQRQKQYIVDLYLWLQLHPE